MPLFVLLRHSRRRRSVSLASLPRMSTRTSMHHDALLSVAARHAHLLLYVGSVFDVLVEVADVAANFLVRLEREGDQRQEAECKPLPVCGLARMEKGRGRGDVTSASLSGLSCCRSFGIGL